MKLFFNNKKEKFPIRSLFIVWIPSSAFVPTLSSIIKNVPYSHNSVNTFL